MAPNGAVKRKGSEDAPKRYDEDVSSISKTNGLEVYLLVICWLLNYVTEYVNQFCK